MSKGKQEWVSFGATGRMRNPAWARSPEKVKEHAKALGETLAYLLEHQDDHPMNAHLKLWYSINTVRQYLKDAEDKLLDDLFHLGVYVPEKFDVRAIKKPQSKSVRKKKP